MPLFAGKLLLSSGPVAAYVEVEEGRILEVGDGEPDRPADAQGWIVPSPVNAHTHVGDAFLRGRSGKPRDLAALVGPGGWKHEQLRKATSEELAAGMQAYTDEMASIGTTRFIDFREGGVAGAIVLRDLAPDLAVEPFILGRPLANDFHDEEARDLLAACDGIGLSAARDFSDFGHVEAWAEACHKARKPFAIHASEAKHEPLERILALEPAFLVHLGQATKRELQQVADQEIPVVVCPRSNAWFGLRTPLALLRDAGVTVAVGTDNGMLQNGDLLAELALAKTLVPSCTDEELLCMLTAGRPLAGLNSKPPRRGDVADLVVYPEHFLPQQMNLKPGFAGFA